MNEPDTGKPAPTTVEDILARKPQLLAQQGTPPEVPTETADWGTAASDPPSHNATCHTEWRDGFSCVHGVIGTAPPLPEVATVPGEAPEVTADHLDLHIAHVRAGRPQNAACAVCAQTTTVMDAEDDGPERDDPDDVTPDLAEFVVFAPTPEAQAVMDRVRQTAEEAVAPFVMEQMPETATVVVQVPLAECSEVVVADEAGRQAAIAGGADPAVVVVDRERLYGSSSYAETAAAVAEAVNSDEAARNVLRHGIEVWAEGVAARQVQASAPAARNGTQVPLGAPPAEVVAEATGEATQLALGTIRDHLGISDLNQGRFVRLYDGKGSVGQILEVHPETDRRLVRWGASDGQPVQTWHHTTELHQVDYRPAAETA